MADLISREAAIEAMRECWRRAHQFAKLFEANRIVDCIQAVKQMPAVDAVPVVHARWVDEDYPYKDANANPRVTAICSKCGNIAHRMEHGYSIFSKYCPNCGAKMDGDKDG